MLGRWFAFEGVAVGTDALGAGRGRVFILAGRQDPLCLGEGRRICMFAWPVGAGRGPSTRFAWPWAFDYTPRVIVALLLSSIR